MKNGKKIPVRIKKYIQAKGLNPDDWLITKNTSTHIELVHRYSTKTKRIIEKEL